MSTGLGDGVFPEPDQPQPPISLHSGSNLLAKRRNRSNSNSSSANNSVSYELTPLLCMPQQAPRNCDCCCGNRNRSSSRAVTGQSVSIRHVQLVERDSAEIVKACLLRMLMRRLAPEQAELAERMLQQQEAGSRIIDGVPQTPQDPQIPYCHGNQLLARRLATLADDFGRSRPGRRVTEQVTGMIPLLPPDLAQSDFDRQLAVLLVGVADLRCRVAILLVACAELAARAVLLCQRAALLTLVAWCQQAFCNFASAFIVLQGWSCLLGEDACCPWTPIAVVLTLLIVGCTLGSILRRKCL